MAVLSPVELLTVRPVTMSWVAEATTVVVVRSVSSVEDPSHQVFSPSSFTNPVIRALRRPAPFPVSRCPQCHDKIRRAKRMKEE